MVSLTNYTPLLLPKKPIETLNRIFRTNRARFLIVVGIITLLFIYFSFLIGWFVNDSSQDRTNVNLAGVQSDLLKDIYSARLATGNSTALPSKIDLFEKNLIAMENSEAAETESQKVIVLASDRTLSVKTSVQAMHASWGVFKQALSQESGIPSADLQNKFIRVQVASDRVIDDMLLRQNEDYDYLVGALLVFVLLNFAALIFSYFFLTAKLISPLAALGKVANRIREGDISTPVTGFGQDEIGLLAQSMEQMRDGIADNARTMQERIASQTQNIRTAFEFSQEIVSQLDLDQLLVSIVTKAKIFSKAEEVTLCLKSNDHTWVRMHARNDHIERNREVLAPCMNLVSRNRGCYFFELPLKVRENTIGYLCVLVDEHVMLSDEDMQALSLLANSSAIAIENARLMTENVKQAQHATQLTERQHIAAELHDSLAQMLSLLKIQIGQVLTAKIDSTHSQIVFYELMQKIQLNIDHANSQVRTLISGLSEYPNSTPVDPDVKLEIEAYINEFQMMTPLDLSIDIAYQEFHELPPLVLRQIFLIMRETLANITRHARASRAGVKIARAADSVILEVVDNGVGFDANTPLEDIHMGLKIMRARAERVRGQLDLISQPGAGTKIIVNIPYTVGV